MSPQETLLFQKMAKAYADWTNSPSDEPMYANVLSNTASEYASYADGMDAIL